jgi:hypothetical protein
MFYEDVKLESGDALSQVAIDYGYKASEWPKIWNDPRNAAVAKKRKEARFVQVGDVLQVPILWEVRIKITVKESDGASIDLWRDGERGRRLTWVQTVDQGNQPAAGTIEFCADGCPADDDLPFYWTNAEIAADPDLRRHFSDHSARGAPTAAQGTTSWRAVVSLAVVTGKRVTVWNSIKWGWDMTPDGTVTLVGPSDAGWLDVVAHLFLLQNGLGTGPATFDAAGWTFQRAP